MPKTVIGSQGVVTTPGSGVTVGGAVTLNSGFTMSSGSINSSQTITRGGVYIISGSSALTVTLPAPGNVVGSPLTFRNASNHAHLLSASLVPQDVESITDGTSVGARLAMPNSEGAAVHMISDGQNYLVLGNSGSFTISTPSS